MPIAFVFPGQGSHRAGALSSWIGHPGARVLDQVADGLGRDIVAISEDEGAGSRTADAQPAIMAASLVAWQAIVDAGIRPDLVAGHSLGEYTATIAAGAMDVIAGARLVGVRGEAMGRACAANPGTMAAVVKLSPDAVAVLVDGIDGLVVANDNAPGQVVVAGTPEAVDAVRSRARDAGGRALPLDVEGAFHSPAMAPAVDAVSAALEEHPPSDPQIPLVSGATAREIERAEPLADALVAGILSPVRWREVQLRLAELGVEDVVEIGPGGVLSGLAKRTLPGVRVHAIATPDDLDAVVTALGTRTGADH